MAAEGERAVVQINRGAQCRGCTACSAFGEGAMRLEALNPVGALPGDQVEVRVEPRRVVRNAMLVFIFPLIMMVGGYFVGSALHRRPEELYGIAGSTAGLVLAFLLLKLIDRRAAEEDAVIVRIMT